MKTLATVLALLLSATVSAQTPAPQAATGQPVLWRDPGPVGSRDLFWGPGSDTRKPAPPFKFVKEDTSGSKPKIRVVDANGVEWNVKFGGNEPGKNEVHAEIAASRLLWALGYVVEEHYYVPSGKVESVKDLERADGVIAKDGTFRIARFQRRSPDASRTPNMRPWGVDQNPFANTRELSGLKLLLALVNNWDNKPENMEIEQTPEGTFYFVSDLGASFGRMSGPPAWSPAPSRWNVAHYREQPFVKGVTADAVQIHYIGQVPMDSVPLEHARWFAELAGQLTAEQVQRAFAAAGANEADAAAFAARVIEKIRELQKAVAVTGEARL